LRNECDVFSDEFEDNYVGREARKHVRLPNPGPQSPA